VISTSTSSPLGGYNTWEKSVIFLLLPTNMGESGHIAIVTLVHTQVYELENRKFFPLLGPYRICATIVTLEATDATEGY
jgi:hypothetical protein